MLWGACTGAMGESPTATDSIILSEVVARRATCQLMRTWPPAPQSVRQKIGLPELSSAQPIGHARSNCSDVIMSQQLFPSQGVVVGWLACPEEAHGEWAVQGFALGPPVIWTGFEQAKKSWRNWMFTDHQRWRTKGAVQKRSMSCLQMSISSCNSNHYLATLSLPFSFPSQWVLRLLKKSVPNYQCMKETFSSYLQDKY